MYFVYYSIGFRVYYRACLVLTILPILAILISGYFVKHTFSFQHIQNINSATVKSHLRFLLSHIILF